MEDSIHGPRQILLRRMLIEKRQGAGLTQWNVADILGKPQSFVSKYETGERELSLIDCLDVLGALGADPVVFLKAFLKKL